MVIKLSSNEPTKTVDVAISVENKFIKASEVVKNTQQNAEKIYEATDEELLEAILTLEAEMKE